MLALTRKHLFNHYTLCWVSTRFFKNHHDEEKEKMTMRGLGGRREERGDLER